MASLQTRRKRRRKWCIKKAEYQAEKILDKTTSSDGTIMHHIKWVNCEDASWEPEENCSNSKALIEDFENLTNAHEESDHCINVPTDKYDVRKDYKDNESMPGAVIEGK